MLSAAFTFVILAAINTLYLLRLGAALGWWGGSARACDGVHCFLLPCLIMLTIINTFYLVRSGGRPERAGLGKWVAWNGVMQHVWQRPYLMEWCYVIQLGASNVGRAWSVREPQLFFMFLRTAKAGPISFCAPPLGRRS